VIEERLEVGWRDIPWMVVVLVLLLVAVRKA